jgi:DNA-binding protein H-NS
MEEFKEFTDLNKLESQIRELQLKKEELIKSQREPKLKEVRDLISLFGFTPSELGIVTVEKTREQVKPKSVPKYRNPLKPEQTWAGGRGKRPAWVVEHEARGGKLSDLEIK